MRDDWIERIVISGIACLILGNCLVIAWQFWVAWHALPIHQDNAAQQITRPVFGK